MLSAMRIYARAVSTATATLNSYRPTGMGEVHCRDVISLTQSSFGADVYTGCSEKMWQL